MRNMLAVFNLVKGRVILICTIAQVVHFYIQCKGEIDIFEQVSGTPEAHGTVHCGDVGGGPCNEPTGRAAHTTMPPDGTFNEYAVSIDRTNDDWRAQTITWTVNGNSFYVLTGADINDAPVWSSLAHSPLYLLLNVAVGGDWPGPPNDVSLERALDAFPNIACNTNTIS